MSSRNVWIFIIYWQGSIWELLDQRKTPRQNTGEGFLVFLSILIVDEVNDLLLTIENMMTNRLQRQAALIRRVAERFLESDHYREAASPKGNLESLILTAIERSGTYELFGLHNLLPQIHNYKIDIAVESLVQKGLVDHKRDRRSWSGWVYKRIEPEVDPRLEALLRKMVT